MDFCNVRKGEESRFEMWMHFVLFLLADVLLGGLWFDHDWSRDEDEARWFCGDDFAYILFRSHEVLSIESFSLI